MEKSAYTLSRESFKCLTLPNSTLVFHSTGGMEIDLSDIFRYWVSVCRVSWFCSPFYTHIPQYWHKEGTSTFQLWLFTVSQINKTLPAYVFAQQVGIPQPEVRHVSTERRHLGWCIYALEILYEHPNHPGAALKTTAGELCWVILLAVNIYTSLQTQVK